MRKRLRMVARWSSGTYWLRSFIMDGQNTPTNTCHTGHTSFSAQTDSLSLSLSLSCTLRFATYMRCFVVGKGDHERQSLDAQWLLW